MLKEFRKKRAIKGYFHTLPALLAKDYGKGSFYTLGQIQSTIKRYKLSNKFVPYAVVLFTPFEEVGESFKQEYPSLNGYKIRAEIADLLFDGDMHYEAKVELQFSEIIHSNGSCSVYGISGD